VSYAGDADEDQSCDSPPERALSQERRGPLREAPARFGARRRLAPRWRNRPRA
jgi:hypothetical protein